MERQLTIICASCGEVIALGTTGRVCFSVCEECEKDAIQRLQDARRLLATQGVI
jgi:predicted RNA-binding Zn-ribbon protein involved in translation (DUF1610 family)